VVRTRALSRWPPPFFFLEHPSKQKIHLEQREKREKATQDLNFWGEKEPHTKRWLSTLVAIEDYRAEYIYFVVRFPAVFIRGL
jgi:hypothetical protein